MVHHEAPQGAYGATMMRSPLQSYENPIDDDDGFLFASIPFPNPWDMFKGDIPGQQLP
jgi:hypothetical protein